LSDVNDFDAIVIGGGHNGLVCAAYLARLGGMKVAVLEQRDILGGFASTESPFASHPEVKVSRFGVDHMHMCSGPVPAELELEKHVAKDGSRFEYLWHDQAHWLYMYPEKRCILAQKDLEATCEAVERVFPGEGRQYRKFTEKWYGILKALEGIDDNPPMSNAVMALGAHLAGNDGITQFFQADPLNFIRRYFETDEMIGMMTWWASQTASPPWQPGSSVLALSLAPATHLTGKARPRGGSGQLSHILADMIVNKHGGAVRTSALVRKILVAEGRARGVEVENRETGTSEKLYAHTVVSCVDAKRLFTEMVADDAVPGWLHDEVRNIYYSTVGLVKADVLINEAPDFAGYFGPNEFGDDEEYNIATGIIAPGYESYVKPGWIDILAGRPSAEPALWCVHNTALDSSLAPEGYHTLWLSQFTPKRLAGGKTWDDVAEAVGLEMFRTYAQYTANLSEENIVDIVVTPPNKMGEFMRTDDPFGVGMNLDQMLGNRPSPHLAQYRTPIRGLYLTGSGTHPGGGITGLPGRNAALEILADLGRSRGTPRQSKLARLRQLYHTYRYLKTFRVEAE